MAIDLITYEFLKRYVEGANMGTNANPRGKWSTNTEYNTGDYVTYRNEVYIALEEHTSMENNPPSINENQWQKIFGINDGVNENEVIEILNNNLNIGNGSLIPEEELETKYGSLEQTPLNPDIVWNTTIRENPNTYLLDFANNTINQVNKDGKFYLAKDNTIELTKDQDGKVTTITIPYGAAGKGALALNTNTHAVGQYSTALGRKTISYGNMSLAEGNLTFAAGGYAHSEGTASAALGEGSHAEGGSTKAEGLYSHAEGNRSKAIGMNSHAEGYMTEAKKANSHAQGFYTKANTFGQSVMGCGNIEDENEKFLFIIGNGKITEHKNSNGEVIDYSVQDKDRSNAMTVDASGNMELAGTVATKTIKNLNQTIENGYYDQNDTASTNRYLGIQQKHTWADASYNSESPYLTYDNISSYLTNGNLNSNVENNPTPGPKVTNEKNYAKIAQTGAYGKAAFAANEVTSAIGNASFTEGQGSIARGEYSHAEGLQTWADNKASHAEGTGTWAKGQSSHAEGYQTKASTSYSHTEGYKSETTGYQSHAEGQNTKAAGSGSHAEGNNTKAYGNNSHAEGYSTQATAPNAHAEGYQTKAINQNAHAEGYITEASGSNSHAEGYQTKALGEKSHTEGTYSQSLGPGAHAEGHSSQGFGGNIASGMGAHAEGYQTKAIGMGAHAEGMGTIIGKDEITNFKTIYDQTTIQLYVDGTQVTKPTYNSTSNSIYKNLASSQSHLIKLNFGNVFANGYFKCTFKITSSSTGSQIENLRLDNVVNNTSSLIVSGANGVLTYIGAMEDKFNSNLSFTIANSTNFTITIQDFKYIPGVTASHVSGYYNQSKTKYQTVIGKYNDPASTAPFVIGWGGDETTRKNIMTVDTSGNMELAGTYFILKSSDSNKKFKITVNDSGNITATEIK